MNEPRPSVERFVKAVIRFELERGGEGHVVQRVMLRFHDGLWKLIGPAGFDVLLARALVLARKDHPALVGVSAGLGGALSGLEAGPLADDALRAGATEIVSRFVELLAKLVGEELALRLVRDVWPGLKEGTW
jgi:hypothetical protein